MKTKNKITLYVIILMVILGILTTSVLGDYIGLDALKGSEQIGESLYLSASDLNDKYAYDKKALYCIQHNKKYPASNTIYVVKDYVEIDGKEAKVYEEANTKNPKIVNDDLNAEVAYILNLNGNVGYGVPYGEKTDSQKALWPITNSWVKALFDSDKYVWAGNDKASENSVNDDAEAYADSIGDQKSTITQESLNVTDKTDKDNISVIDVGEYYRVGPFRWEFDGKIESIIVTGNNGTISSSNVRFVKYEGTTPKTVKESEISTGEAFYVDIKYTSGATEFKGLKLNTVASGKNMTIYTAKIWFLQSSNSQNFIYTEVDEKEVEPATGECSIDYNIPLNIDIGFVKVDDRDMETPLSGVGFKFKATVYRYIKVSENSFKWQWVERYLGADLRWSSENIEGAKTFYTDKDGKMNITGISAEDTYKDNIKAVEVSNPNYGYEVGQEYKIESKIPNHQTKVKLSGYVWLDQGAEKETRRNDLYDSNFENDPENSMNGITVYLKDIDGNVIGTTTTSELGLYEEKDGGEYQFVDVDLDKVQAGEYYVEFEYCGITYQSVEAKLDQANGSKAIDTTSRNILDSKFTSVDSTGTQNLSINGVNINYSNISNHSSKINNCTGCNVVAKTNDEAGEVYNLYDGFVPGTSEIRNINLGLFEKPQADYALAQDLYNVRVEVNGFSHIYRYAGVRYTNEGNTVNEESSWNLGVKFQNNKGTYSRAIYTSDVQYESPNHRDNELKVYLTYKVALKNESTYLARINSIVNYSDIRYEMINAGTQIDDNDNITDKLNFGAKQNYNDEYSKYIIDVNTVIKSGEANYIYLQFELDREAVLTILNNGETLNNVAEINSYTTFKNNDINSIVSTVDNDSVPGNMIPGQIDTYEDDTDAARSLQLELKDERALTGTVFVDSTGKDSNFVYSGEERLGNGIFDEGETILAGVEVNLRETGKDDSSYDGERVEMETVTDENGNFTFTGFIPGNYIVTYTWGDKTYKVQYYKGTIYDENRDTSNGYWYKDSVDVRNTDALDNMTIRKQIDDEMEKITINTLEAEINKAYEEGSEVIKTTTMDSSTPIMSISVEYDTTITDATVGDKVQFTIKNVDFGIVERPKQQVELEKRVSGLKVTLANGQVLVDAEVTEDGQLKGKHDYVTYMGPTSTNGIETNGTVKAEIDSELIEGAIMEITYSIKAINTSELDYTSEGYYYYGNKNNANYVKTSVTGVIDYLDGRVSAVEDTTWEEVDETFLSNYNINKNGSERIYTTTQLSKELKPGESSEVVTFKTSKLLTSSDDNYFNNEVEITEVVKTDADITGTPVKVTFSEETYHFDIDFSEMVTIIPSTGEDRAYVLPTIIGISSLILLGVGVFVIKKFILNNK